MTQRIERFLKIWLKELNTFWKHDSKNSTSFMNLTLFPTCLKELNFCFLKNQRIDFFNMTQRTDFSQRLKEFIVWKKKKRCWRKELNPYLYNSKIWTLFQKWRKESIFLSNNQKKTLRIELSLFNMTLRVEQLFNVSLRIEPLFNLAQKELDFFKNDSKNWTLLTQRIELFLCLKKKRTWLKELNFLYLHYSKHWTFFFTWLK